MSSVLLKIFVIRNEIDGLIEQDDLLNQDSFISGLKFCPLTVKYFTDIPLERKVIRHYIHVPLYLLSPMSLCTGDFGISAVSPPHRNPMPESRFMPSIGTPNHSTPRLVSQLAVSKHVR